MTGILEGKATIVTGAAAGIGRGIANVFIREGAKVLLADFSGGQDEAAKALGPNAVPFQCDVSKEDQVEAMFARAIEAFGRVDGVVNNAGTVGGWRGEFTIEEYEQMTEVNLKGVALCCKHAIRAMADRGGSVVNISSVSGFTTEHRTSLVYAAAKAGVISLTKTFAVQHGPQGIRFNAIAPGFTQGSHQRPAEWIEMISQKAPLRRIAKPEEQGEVAAFLISDRASYVTGQTIAVDGGWSAQVP